MGVVNQNAQSSNGTTTLTASAGPGIVWNLTSLSVSQAGPTIGPNAKVTVYDGSAATGTVIFAVFLPGAGTGSVGNTYDVPIPKDARGLPALQSTPGNAMTVVCSGTGANQVSMNARFTDGLT